MTARLTNEDVVRLAALARLELTADEIARLAGQLSEILAFAAEVQAVAEPRSTPPPDDTHRSRLRDDTLLPSLGRSEILSAAPEADPASGLITVPRVFGT